MTAPSRRSALLRTLVVALLALVLGAPGVAAPASAAKPKTKAVPGELVSGGPALTVAITTPGQNARPTFQGTAGRRVSFVLSSVSISSSQVTILRPNGTTLAAVLVSPTGRTFTLDLSATGTPSSSSTRELRRQAA